MILFLDDFRKYPSAIIDTETDNKSFIRLASVYRSMGIKNNSFILALLNPKLKGIDPFDPNLTLEQMAMIAIECKNNPWYFLRSVARVPGEGSNVAVKFEANRANIAIWWCFFNHITTFLIQPRQTGKSFAIDTLDVLLLNIICQNTKINLLTKDETLRRKNIQQIKDIANELPKYLQQRTKDDTNNTEEITVKSLGNKYTAHVPQASAKRAYNMGRGLVTSVIRVDEPPFQPNIALALPALLAATGAAFDAAKRANVPYGITLTTTAGKKDDRDGKYIYNLISDSAIWTEKFYDCTDLNDLENTVKRNSRAGVCRINATFNHRQLGKTDEWLKEKIDTSTQSGDDANRDYFNLWTSGSQTNPIPTHILERISKSSMPPLYTDISKPHGYITRWYIDEEMINDRLNNGQFVLGVDTSDASGGDDIALVLTDVETLEVIFAANVNETNLITFSEWICSILVTFKNITAIIERRSTGSSVLDYLLLMLPQYGIDPFQRLFNRVVNDYDEMPDRWREVRQPMNRRSSDIYTRYKKTFGFATSGTGYASRTEIYSTTIQNAAKRSCDKVKDKTLINQITSLISKNGRIDHEDGEHDDLCISWLLTHWLISNGKNLSFYGIDIKRVMSTINSKPEESNLDIHTKNEQQAIRERIEALYDRLTKEQDDFISMRIEHELRALDSKIVLESGEIYSLDGLIQQAREVKQNKRRNYEQNKSTNKQINYSDFYSDRKYNDTSGVFSDRPLSISEILGR
jgi:hypothetical protein